ncbi:hypothetical protein CEXT_322631 [Caerostris extrusa]|uniref:Uncharacterized protein n=1 Tax=Caerostris extrusa TaxID=172846 RepID=A0AAV4W375_CAEEX|nr:hypothetical protein CEXT_322631 [Caerostris extrusa]
MSLGLSSQPSHYRLAGIRFHCVTRGTQITFSPTPFAPASLPSDWHGSGNCHQLVCQSSENWKNSHRPTQLTLLNINVRHLSQEVPIPSNLRL